MRFLKEWRRARRRARTIGVPTWYMTDDEVATSIPVACAIAGWQAKSVAAAMKSLSAATQAAGSSMQSFAQALRAVSASA